MVSKCIIWHKKWQNRYNRLLYYRIDSKKFSIESKEIMMILVER